jgi:uncharacterized membrane protein
LAWFTDLPEGNRLSPYDFLVNDYLRAVEQALDGVPANRRAELLAGLSDHITAKRAELGPEASEVEVRSVLDLLGDPADVAAALDDPEPIELEPKRKSAALIWVLITIAASVSLCLLGVLAIGLLAFFLRG